MYVQPLYPTHTHTLVDQVNLSSRLELTHSRRTLKIMIHDWQTVKLVKKYSELMEKHVKKISKD